MTRDYSTPVCIQPRPANPLEIPNHAVIILASGLSQRLGQAKQLLLKNGEPLICLMTKLAMSTKPQTIIVVIPDNKSAIVNAIIELAVAHSTIKIVVNPTPEIGMAHSLNLGIEALTCLINSSIDKVLIMGVDQVLLDVQHLTELLAGKTTVVASSYSSWQHSNSLPLNETSAINLSKQNIIGLPLTIDYNLLKQWQAALSGDKGLRYLIRDLPFSEISTVVNNYLSYDIDTPEQLAYAKQQGWLDN